MKLTIPVVTAILLALAAQFSINGVDLAPVEKTAEWGKKIVAYRADQAVAAIRKSMNR
jgi:creatinine amidohydrolase